MSAPTYQGQSLGLPPAGGGSVAPLLRRTAAFFVDWALCLLIAVGLGMPWGEVQGAWAFLPLALLFAMNVLLVSTLGTTIGHRLLGLRVVSVDALERAAPPAPLRSVGRAALIVLFVPAIIMDADGRGLHDKAARTVVVRAR